MKIANHPRRSIPEILGSRVPERVGHVTVGFHRERHGTPRRTVPFFKMVPKPYLALLNASYPSAWLLATTGDWFSLQLCWTGFGTAFN